jgi:hypothetical protein
VQTDGTNILIPNGTASVDTNSLSVGTTKGAKADALIKKAVSHKK